MPLHLRLALWSVALPLFGAMVFGITSAFKPSIIVTSAAWSTAAILSVSVVLAFAAVRRHLLWYQFGTGRKIVTAMLGMSVLYAISFVETSVGLPAAFTAWFGNDAVAAYRVTAKGTGAARSKDTCRRYALYVTREPAVPDPDRYCASPEEWASVSVGGIIRLRSRSSALGQYFVRLETDGSPRPLPSD